MAISKRVLGGDGELYLDGTAATRPGVLVIPLLGRLAFLPDLAVERWIARFFARRGFAAALVARPFFEWTSRAGLGQVDRYLADTVERAKRVVDRLSAEDGVDVQRIGTLGISFGAVVSALLTQSLHFRAHVIAMGGANLAKVLASSRDPLVKSYFRGLLRVTGLSQGDLVSRLGEVFQHDPLRLKPAIPPEQILTVRASFDRVVRPCYGKALWAVLGRPREIVLPLGHYTALAALPMLLRIALRFFRLSLGSSEATARTGDPHL